MNILAYVKKAPLAIANPHFTREKWVLVGGYALCALFVALLLIDSYLFYVTVLNPQNGITTTRMPVEFSEKEIGEITDLLRRRQGEF